MSYQVADACYDTALMAAQVSASRGVGGLVSHVNITYSVDVSTVSATQITYLLTPAGGGTALTLAAPYTAQPCNLMGASDALEMSWLVVAAWAGVYGLMFLARALKGETGGDYGNA